MTNTTTCPTTQQFREIYTQTRKLTRDSDLKLETRQWVGGEWIEIRITSANGPGVLFHLNGERISKSDLQKIIG
jgi:hypothetical protein